jgi:hypothetical protein
MQLATTHTRIEVDSDGRSFVAVTQRRPDGTKRNYGEHYARREGDPDWAGSGDPDCPYIEGGPCWLRTVIFYDESGQNGMRI